MFARMIRLAAKTGRGKELTKGMTERSLTVLKQQPGFVEAIALTSETEQDQVVGISIWNRKRTPTDSHKVRASNCWSPTNRCCRQSQRSVRSMQNAQQSKSLSLVLLPDNIYRIALL
jgi:hypothetical protein